MDRPQISIVPSAFAGFYLEAIRTERAFPKPEVKRSGRMRTFAIVRSGTGFRNAR